MLNHMKFIFFSLRKKKGMSSCDIPLYIPWYILWLDACKLFAIPIRFLRIFIRQKSLHVLPSVHLKTWGNCHFFFFQDLLLLNKYGNIKISGIFLVVKFVSCRILGSVTVVDFVKTDGLVISLTPQVNILLTC